MATIALASDGAPPSAQSYHAAGRRNLLDFDLDEPPSYNDAEGAPAYSREAPREASGDEGRQLDGSALVYSLRQLGRKRQAFVSMGPPLNLGRQNSRSTEIDTDVAWPWTSASREFIIEHKSGAGFSKTKPDFVIMVADREQRADLVLPPRRRSSLFRVSTTRDVSPEPPDMRRRSVAAPGEAAKHNQAIASVRFLRSGPLPWTPRATLIYEAAFVDSLSQEGHHNHGDRKQDLQLKRADANGWTISIFNRNYIWCLLASPSRLALVDLELERERASFTYSETGTFADKGGEIGRLRVPLESFPSTTHSEAGHSGYQDGFIEQVICSLSAAVVHWRNEGKAIHNARSSKPPDIVGDRMPLGSATAMSLT